VIARRQSDMLAYADNCMEDSQREAFEALMAAEPDIRRQVEEWRRQNEAIRAAFANAREWPAPIRAQFSANENARSDWMPQPVKNMRRLSGARQPPRLIVSASRNRAPTPAEAQRRVARMSAWRQARLLLGALIVGVALLGSASGANVNSRAEETVGAGVSAYRTYALGVSSPAEFATSDARLLRRWLASQIARVTPIPDLSQIGLTLAGGRVVSGAHSPAAFLLYQTSGQARIGLLVESLDAPAQIAPQVRRYGSYETAYWTGSGHGFALVGALGEQQMGDLTRLVAGN
jgi:anti-sigma factor RsiW